MPLTQDRFIDVDSGDLGKDVEHLDSERRNQIIRANKEVLVAFASLSSVYSCVLVLAGRGLTRKVRS